MDKENLILLIQGNEGIYNPKHPKYRDRDYAKAVWQGIARQFNMTDLEVKAKWQSLKSSYRRERRKLNIASRTDTKSVPNINWPYLKLMSFLDPIYSTLEYTEHEESADVPESAIVTTDETAEDNIVCELQEETKESHPEEKDCYQQIYNIDGETSNGSTSTVSLIGSKRKILTNEAENKMQDSQRAEKRRNKIKSNTESEIDMQDLRHFDETADKMKDDKDPDLLFFRSLLPWIKQLGLQNLQFKGEVIDLLQKKLNCNSKPPITNCAGTALGR